MTEQRRPRPGGTRPRQARQANTAAVLQLLVQRGRLARGDIARELSLNHGSVSRIIDPLLQAGIVREVAQQAVRVGRPRVPVEINPAGRYAVGVHLGLERTTVGLTDLSGRCIEEYAEERDPTDVAATLRRAAELTGELAAAAPGPVLGVGAVTGGEVDRAGGRVVRNDTLGWVDVDVAGRLRERSRLDVVVDSNVRAQLGAEMMFGVGVGQPSVLYLFVGNLVEMGFVGRATEADPDGIIQGSVGRIVVPSLSGDDRADFGACGTDRALLAAARSSGLAVTSLAQLAELADHGADRVATSLLHRRSTQIARVVDTLYDLMQPSQIIVGGSGAPSNRCLDVVRGQVQAAPPERLVRPRSGGNTLVTAAAGLVIRAFLATGAAQNGES